MMKIFYEDIHVADFASNRSMTVEEMLDQLEFDEQAFIEAHGFDAIDYNDFRVLSGIEADKELARDLFRRWDELQQDPRRNDEGAGVGDRNSPQVKWLEDTDPIFYEMIRLYIRHVATEDWIFNSLIKASAAMDTFDTVEGERKMFEELRNWAE